MRTKTLMLCVIALIFMAAPVSAKNDKQKSLPPGLQKNYEQGKPLPPGWDKKLSKGDILDDSIYARGKVVIPRGKDGTISIEVEGKIFKLYENTRQIIDILR